MQTLPGAGLGLCVFILLMMFASVTSAGTLVIGGSGSGLAAIRHLAADFASRTGTEVTVLPSIGTGGAIKALRKGDIHVGLASRSLDEQELGVDLIARKYAETPLVFAVSKDLPINGVTREQILAMFSGEISEWREGLPVRPILRPRRDSDTLILVDTLPRLGQVLDRKRARNAVVAFTDQENAAMLEKVPGSIGTTSLSLIRAEFRNLRALHLDGLDPETDGQAGDAYPMRKPLYFVTRTETSPAARDFIGFAGREGRAYLQRTGHWLVD